jgi:hypothetical protein
MISEKTVAASVNRFAGSLSLAKSGAIANVAIKNVRISLPLSPALVHYGTGSGILPRCTASAKLEMGMFFSHLVAEGEI